MRNQLWKFDAAKTCVTSLGLTLVFGIMPIAALAGDVTAFSDGSTTWKPSVVPNSGSGAVQAAVSSPNGVPAYAATHSRVATPTVAAAIPVYSFWFSPTWYFGQGLNNPSKAAGDVDAITGLATGTTPSPFPAGTSPSAAASANMTTGATNVTLVATASVDEGDWAVARAKDPLTFASGTTAFETTLNSLSLASTGVPAEYYIYGSSTISGLTNLFTLAIGVAGTVTSPADVLIYFRSNPLLGLDDAAIKSQIQSDLSVSGNAVSLMSPLNIDYSLSSAGSYDAGLEVDAAASAVPEPSTFALLGVGTLSLLACVRRR